MPHRTALRVYYFALFASMGVYLPFFPAWLEARGLGGLSMSAITAVAPAMAVMAPPLAGILVDFLGLRGSLLRWACAGACIVFFFLTVYTSQNGELDFSAVFLAILIYALCRAPMHALAEVIALEEGSDYARLRLWGSIGFLCTAFGAGFALDGATAIGVPLAIALLLTLALGASFLLPARASLPQVPPVEEVKRLFRDARYRWFLLTAFLSSASHSSYDLCSSLWFRDLGGGTQYIGTAWAIGTGSEILLMAVSAPLLGRFAAVHLRSFAFAVTILRWLLLATVPSLPWLLALQSLHAITFALMWVSSVAMLQSFASPRSLGTAQGVFAGISALGSAVGMVMWGPLYQRAGGSTLFFTAALAASMTLAGNGLLTRALKQDEAKGSRS